MIVLCLFQNPHPQNLGWTENSLRVLARVYRRGAVREGGWGRALEVAREGGTAIITIIHHIYSFISITLFITLYIILGQDT